MGIVFKDMTPRMAEAPGMVEQVEAAGVRVLAPVAKPKVAERDPHQPLPTDSPVLAAWRVRMGLEETKLLYRLRAATIECVNAKARCKLPRSLPA